MYEIIKKSVDKRLYRVRREKFDTAHRKVDGIEMNIKVSYHLTIFAIIIEILIFEIVLMRARREKRSSRSRYSPAQCIITLAVGGALERQEGWRAVARRPAPPPLLPLRRTAHNQCLISWAGLYLERLERFSRRALISTISKINISIIITNSLNGMGLLCSSRSHLPSYEQWQESRGSPCIYVYVICIVNLFCLHDNYNIINCNSIAELKKRSFYKITYIYLKITYLSQ